MQIGIVLNPTEQPDWPQMKAFLTPAARLGGVPILESGELVWAIYEGPELLGCATARLTHEGFGEVVLVGGKDSAGWIHQLDWLLCSWMRREGMKSIRAYGRKGWARVLKDWAIIGSDGKTNGYEKVL